MNGVLGVVLDVDDTLYLERDYVRSGFRHVERWLADEYGVHGVGAEAWRLFVGGVRRTTLGDALNEVVGDSSLLPVCVKQYRSHEPDIELLRDAKDLFDRLRGTSPVAAVTDGPAVSQRAKCRALGLVDVAEPIIITDEMGTSKPDPSVYEAATLGWGIEPENLVYVADNPAKDFTAPIAMGWQTVRVRRVGSLHYSLPTPQHVDEVADLRGLFRKAMQDD